ncbi:MAG TPA: flagellar hook protein FlgE [Syntrophomonadaceae bacterium]|nr:flagellar hook protein FlgE [Syntrophomonadaceae bacterium]
MMRSMYSGVSGLKNHQTKMDVIGNNIANVNTTGFKKSRVVFKDTLYQTIRGASRSTSVRGGTNPMGVGLGMTLASIDQIHTNAPTTVTNKLTDMAVDGNGYFIVSNGDEDYYTRAGDFDFDTDGNLVSTSNGYKVQGWLADRDKLDSTGDWAIDTTGGTIPIDIYGFKSVSPKATSKVDFGGNLDSGTATTTIAAATDKPAADAAVVTSKEIYDSLGNKQTVYFKFFKVGADQWDCDVSLDSGFTTPAAGLGSYTSGGNLVDGAAVRVTGIKFKTDGSIDTTSPNITNINLTIPRTAQGADDIKVNIDVNQLTQYDSKSTAWAEKQNGYTQGDLNSYTVGIDGVIKGVYSNGEVKSLARVAVANFQNPAGLLQTGGTMFQISNNSGDARIGAPGEQGMGAIIPGSLEMSNVDLSEELTDMIVAQRGFQANSRIITTSDEMLQELVNLKRS